MALQPLGPELEQVLRDLNPWWAAPHRVRPEPPDYVRPTVAALAARMRAPRGLIEVVRGPRQVGKTTGIQQIIRSLLDAGTSPTDVLFLRFDLELLRSEPSALRRYLRWFTESIRSRPLDDGARAYLFLDEIHKLPRWSEEVKHVGDTFPLRILLTGSSSVLVARGGRESLAGRVFTTELPPFSFREVVECWHPDRKDSLPPRIRFLEAFDGGLADTVASIRRLKPQQQHSLRRILERYYQRGGYPRLHSGEVEDDRWADYLTQTVFENVLGADIPDLFPVENPKLLRAVYLWVARHTATEIAQGKLAQELTLSGIPTNQPTVGRYLHYLEDALLTREFRRYPLAKKASARVPAKITLSDLGVRNAVLRGAPSLWESDPTLLGPLVETLVQGSIRDHGLQVHFYRDFEQPRDRRSRVHEVDFIAERSDGEVLPLEVKFRKRIDEEDWAGVRHFQERFAPPVAVVVTRDTAGWEEQRKVQFVPLLTFLLAF